MLMLNIANVLLLNIGQFYYVVDCHLVFVDIDRHL